MQVINEVIAVSINEYRYVIITLRRNNYRMLCEWRLGEHFFFFFLNQGNKHFIYDYILLKKLEASLFISGVTSDAGRLGSNIRALTV